MKLDLHAERRGLIAEVGVFVFVSLVLGVSLVALASDPWKDKDYKAWTADEVQKILWEIAMGEDGGGQRSMAQGSDAARLDAYGDRLQWSPRYDSGRTDAIIMGHR